MDPFEVVSTFLFQQPCRRPHGDARALGGILGSWPDSRIEIERDQHRQNPVYPGMMTSAESMWRGVAKEFQVESELPDSYEIDGKGYRWMDRRYGAATV